MNKDELFDLCVYLATSAEGLRDEPKDYGPLRLLEVLERLAAFAVKQHEDPFLREVADEVNEKKDLVMFDSAAFYQFIEQLVVKFAKEAKRRYATGKEQLDARSHG